MPLDKFRRQLRQEAEQWRTEGLIDDSVYEQLSERYQFSDLETAARNRFVVILLGLGSILLGLGVITFVAANWQAWHRELKVILLLSVFLAVNITGFYLWRRPIQRWQRRLGQGLLLLGGLILGANMALMSQMFHQSGLLYQLYLLWGLGLLAMAYGLQLTSLGILAILLISLGYIQGQGQPEFLAIGEFSWLRQIVKHLPILAILMFIPLAYWCRSRWIFRLGAIATVCFLEANLIELNLPRSPAWIAAVACALPAALLWGYRDNLWVERLQGAESFNSTARTLAITFLGVVFYLLSFHGWWDTSSIPSVDDTARLPSYLLVDILILICLTIGEWLRLWRRLDLTTIFVAGMIVVGGLIPYWHLSTGGLTFEAVLSFNLLLFVLAVGLVRQGLAQGQRKLFWGGMVLLTLQILTRMWEYDTDLLFKSFVLLLCGFGVIAAGLWFERYVRKIGVGE